MTGASGYAGRHLEQNDYYAEGERVKGQWYGKGADQLGLHGELQPEQFEAIRQGLHPETGEFLRPRHSADRIFGTRKTVDPCRRKRSAPTDGQSARTGLPRDKW